jgi:hypothetical protein
VVDAGQFYIDALQPDRSHLDSPRAPILARLF